MSDEAVIEDPVVLRDMNAQLVEQCVGLEDQLRNRDLADFADVITDESRAFWTEQLLANRDGAVTALNAVRGRIAVVEPVVVPAATAAPAAADVRHPLHNRATARPIPPAIVGGVGNQLPHHGIVAGVLSFLGHRVAGAGTGRRRRGLAQRGPVGRGGAQRRNDRAAAQRQRHNDPLEL